MMAGAEADGNLFTERIILASASPRRARLLRDAVYRFEVMAPTIDEPVESGANVPPAHCAEALSYFKARGVALRVGRGLVVAADTIAAAGGHLFGKPRDRADAARILRALTGTVHEVITGVTLLDAASLRRDIRHDVTRVTMRSLDDRELDEYLDSGAWSGKAGAYGIQDHGDGFVERVDGSFSNVVGLPMELLSRMLADWTRPPCPHAADADGDGPTAPACPPTPGNVSTG